MKKVGWWYRFRSAVTGRIVKKAEAEAEPDKHVKEKVKKRV